MAMHVMYRLPQWERWVAQWLEAWPIEVDKTNFQNMAMIISNEGAWTGPTTENVPWMTVLAILGINRLLDMVEGHLLDRLQRPGHTGGDAHPALLRHQDMDDCHHLDLLPPQGTAESLRRDPLQREVTVGVLRQVLHKRRAHLDTLLDIPHRDLSAFSTIGQYRPLRPCLQILEGETR